MTNLESERIPRVAGAGSIRVELDKIELVDRRFAYGTHPVDEDLESDIRANGVEREVDLWVREDGGLVVIDGFQRIDALLGLRSRSVPACIHEVSEKEAHAIALQRHFVKNGLTGVKLARAIRKARNRGRSLVEIAGALSMSTKQLLRYEHLLDLPEAIRDAVEKGDLPMAHADVLRRARVSDAEPWTTIVKRTRVSASELDRMLHRPSAADSALVRAVGGASDEAPDADPGSSSALGELRMLTGCLERALERLAREEAEGRGAAASASPF